jgi:cysteine desulfurase
VNIPICAETGHNFLYIEVNWDTLRIYRMIKNVYLDNAATTPVDPRVLEAMLPFFNEVYGNANSAHGPGRHANVAVENARDTIAQIIGSEPSEIIFTSGGTESNNATIKGVLRASGKKHLITSKAEHHAVLHPVEHATSEGAESTLLAVNPLGFVSATQVADAIRPDTILVTLMHANNEIGSINPISEIAEICKSRGVLLHSDTVQSAGKIPVNVDDLGVDFLSISGHKIYGPKGVGILYVKNGTQWTPWMEGGSQERKRRGGTLNVPGIVGMAKALELTSSEMIENKHHISTLKNALVSGLKDRFEDRIAFNGDIENGLYNIVNCSFPMHEGMPLDGEMLLLSLDIEGISCSNGSACASGAVEPSHVLMSLGLDRSVAKSSVRFSLGKQNTMEDIHYTIEKLEFIVNRMVRTSVRN